MKKMLIFVPIFIIFCLTGCDLSPGGSQIVQIEESTVDESVISQDNSDDSDREDLIWVHVCGEVQNPGLYSFPEGSRVYDAVEAAGGFTKEADQDSVNLAMSLMDEGKVYIPSLEDKNELSDAASHPSDGKVNLNTATLDDLMSLPGIGAKRAEAILALRKAKGSFQKVEELLEADGIKEGIYEQIKGFVKV